MLISLSRSQKQLLGSHFQKVLLVERAVQYLNGAQRNFGLVIQAGFGICPSYNKKVLKYTVSWLSPSPFHLIIFYVKIKVISILPASTLINVLTYKN